MPFGLTASCWISIFSIIYILVYKFIIDKDSKSRYKKIFFLIAIGSILYILLLQVAYYTQFSESEAISHASMQRYVGTIFIMILMFIVGIVFNQSNSNTIYILVPALLLPFTPISLISNATITSGINNYINRNNQIEVIEFSEYVNSKVDSNSKIFPIHQTQNKDSYLLQFRYYMTPNFIPMVDTFNDNEEYSFVKFHSTEEFEKELYKYDYVAVLKTDEYFINKYSSLFEDSTISDWSLYKVTKKEDKILLIKVE
jgi:hypothetical protein